MEQEKLYVIEEKTYEAHIDEEVHLYGLLPAGLPCREN